MFVLYHSASQKNTSASKGNVSARANSTPSENKNIDLTLHEKSFQRPIENLRLFHVRHVRSVFDYFQARAAEASMHELSISHRPDRILAAHDDQHRHVDARQVGGIV